MSLSAPEHRWPVTTGSYPRPLPFVGIDELRERPHVVVDGAARPGTVRALTHWPSSPTPATLARDLSAQIALAYLDAPQWWPEAAEAVTNDHLDQDGLVSLYALVDPPAARASATLLTEIARVGDFAVVRDDVAATIAFAIAALGDPERTSLACTGAPGPRGGTVWAAGCTAELLGRLPDLLAHPERHRSLYAEELAALEASRRAIERGAVVLRTVATADLAVLDVAARVAPVTGTRFCHRVTAPLHPAAAHSLADAARVLVAQGRRYRYYDRYETWVRYVSRPLPLRRDLGPLAERLSGEERGGAQWVAEPPGALEPSLELAGGDESSLPLARVGELIAAYLQEAPVAWDPFRAAGALVGAGLSGQEAPTGGTNGRGPSRRRGRHRARPSA